MWERGIYIHFMRKGNKLNSAYKSVAIGAYVYPGWHACPVRDLYFPSGWSEWDLVLNAPSRFPDHNQPRLPLNGPYDDSFPATARKQTELACEFGVDFLCMLFSGHVESVCSRRLLIKGF